MKKKMEKSEEDDEEENELLGCEVVTARNHNRFVTWRRRRSTCGPAAGATWQRWGWRGWGVTNNTRPPLQRMQTTADLRLLPRDIDAETNFNVSSLSWWIESHDFRRWHRAK